MNQVVVRETGFQRDPLDSVSGHALYTIVVMAVGPDDKGDSNFGMRAETRVCLSRTEARGVGAELLDTHFPASEWTYRKVNVHAVDPALYTLRETP